MLLKVFLTALFLTFSSGTPTPDKLQRSYRPPQNQYSQPQYFRPQPQPQPQPQYSQPEPQYQPQPQPRYEEPRQVLLPPKYDFAWEVKDDYSGNDFGHQESKDGYRTDGSYHVLLPDGRRQRVKYFVDGDSGYIAEVTYEGEARYDAPVQPSYQPAPQPSYQPAPQPSYQPAPQPTYQRPQQTYQQPQRRYNF